MLLAPVTAAGTALVPVSVAAAGAVAVYTAATATPARAASGSALVLSTSVNGGTSSTEAQQATLLGYTVTVASPSTWDAMTTAQFKAYSALIIGDPSSGGTCASSVPADALSTAATWGPAVTGNVAVLGTAPVQAGSAGGKLLDDAVSYALAGSGTGLYVSLNCEYSTAAAGTSVPLLAHVGDGGFAVTGQGSSCPSNAGTVNVWAILADTQFNGLGDSAIGPWASPACSVQETFTSWSAGLSGLAYDSAATPADFTASDGAAGQAYLLAGALPSGPTKALAPSTGGELPLGAAIGGTNPADAAVAQATAGDPVNSENGDFSQSYTDVNTPTFGPTLDFTRTYDALLAQEQTQTGTPGAMGYGWTDDWASSLSLGRTVPGDVYTVDGLATGVNDGGLATAEPLNESEAVAMNGSDRYIADTGGNRVEEVAGANETEWGISMLQGHMYTIVGSPTGQGGQASNGATIGPNGAARLNQPAGVAINGSGLYISDTGNCRVLKIPSSGADADLVEIYAGRNASNCSVGGDKQAATASNLNGPQGLHFGFASESGDLYIADTNNDRIQEVAGANETEWGQMMTAGDVYTVAGTGGVAGASGNGTAAASSLLDLPDGVTLNGNNDLFIADTDNCRVEEALPVTRSDEWNGNLGTMNANDIYTIAGRGPGSCGGGNNNKEAIQSDLSLPDEVAYDATYGLYIADSGSNVIKFVADNSSTMYGQTMTEGDIYALAGTGTSGDSGDGGAALSAELDEPGGIAVAGGTVTVADTGNSEIRQLGTASPPVITDLAGGIGGFGQDGDNGPAVDAGLQIPNGVASDAAGDIFIADTTSNRVQEISASNHTQFGITMQAGDVYTVAGQENGLNGLTGDGGKATAAYLRLPVGVAVDPGGNLYIDDDGNCRIQEVAAATGDVSTIAGSAAGTCGFSGNGGPATSALLNDPLAVAVDGSGDVFVADGLVNEVQEVPAATGGGMTKGDIYDIAGSPTALSGASGDGGPAASALLSTPSGVATDAAGDLYITDSSNSRIQEIAAAGHTQWGISMTAGDIYTVAGSSAGTAGNTGDGGAATAALLNVPSQVAVDASGDLYITDTGNSRIREVAAGSGTQWGQIMTAGHIYNVAGNSAGTFGNSGDGGPATAALMNSPAGIGTDQAGDLFFTDGGNDRLREVTATASPLIATSPGGIGITVNQADGSQVTFYPQTGGSCTAPYVKAGGYCALPQYTGATLTGSSSTYTYSPQPGTTYTYGSGGALKSEADAAGDTLNLSSSTPAPGSGDCPSTASTCETITSASGRAIVIGSSSAGLVTSVTDSMGRTWTYGYTGSDLTSATDPVGNVTSYTYGAGGTGNPMLAHDMLTITSPNAQPGGPDAGDATVNVYNSAGQVTSQTDPSGFKTTFNYCENAGTGNCMNASTGTGFVTVTDPNGNTEVDDFTQGALAATSSYNGGSALYSELDYVPDTAASGSTGGTLLYLASTDGQGNISAFSYDAAGNPTSATGPGANDSQATTTDAYTSALQDQSCEGTAEAAASATCSQDAGPAVVAPGGVITPPPSAPPSGLTYALYDSDGNELYSSTGVFEPGATTAAYTQTSYQLFNGNSVTLPGTSSPVTCAASAPSMSLPCATINADGVVTQIGYNAQGDVTSASTPDGNGSQVATSTATYDADGEELTEVAPDGNVAGANAGNYTTSYSYNADGQETSQTEGGGTGFTDTPRTATYGYDADGDQVMVKNPRGNTTTTTFNADNRPALVTNPDGDSTLTCYDGAGEVTQTVPAAGVAANHLTAASCPTSYPAGYTDRLAADATTHTYNSDDHQTAITTPAPAGQSGPQTTTITYDGAGDPLTITAPSASNGGPAQVTTDTYNSDGDVATQTTGSGTSAASTVSYCYDPNGETTSVVYADGNATGTAPCQTSSPWNVSAAADPTQAGYQTTYAYDSAGELVSTTTPATTAAPSGATSKVTYDPAGNLLTSTDPNGVTTTRTYTPLDQVASVSYSGSSAHSVTHAYDADGNQTGMTDATGTSSDVYNSFGELTSAVNGAGQATGYGYNADGQVTGITYPLPVSATWATSDTVSYGYDNADKLTSVTDFNGHQITIGNTADGLPDSAALGSTGDTITTTYDNTDHPSVISLTNSAATLQSFSYSEAPAGNILSETDTPSSSHSPVTYTYDAKGRVTSMTAGTGSALDYSFDPSGNLRTLPNGATSTYDNAGELTASVQSGTTTSYTYNADGERLAAAQGGTTVANGAWNGAGQLTSYDSNAADMTSATYDGNGDRATATTGSATQSFVWNTVPSVPQLIMDSGNAYIYTTGTTPAEQVSLSSGAVNYLTADLLGSVRDTVSSAGALTGTTSYDAWGNPQATGGLSGTTPFGYAGGYTDPDGLIYLLNRYYDPATGQFTSVDPDLADTLAPYSYGGDNPVTNTDPTGQWWVFQTILSLTPLTSNLDYDFSVSMNKELVIVVKKAGKIARTVSKWLSILAAVLAPIITKHPEIVVIIGAVAGLLAAIGMGLKRLAAIIKAAARKNNKAHLYGWWAKTWYSGGPFGSWYYQHWYHRTCTKRPGKAKTKDNKCGSPGIIAIGSIAG